MSLEIARQVHAEYPHLLTTNLGSTCHQYTVHLIALLRSLGHEAYHVCKSPGEGQVVPPGFQPRDVIGLDGKTYRCSGLSHDAIWCDGQQFDTIGSANEYDRPIYRKVGSPFWSFDAADGPQIVAFSVWNEIARDHWRHNNPPLKDAVTVPVPAPAPKPQAPSPEPYPGDTFFIEQLGTVLAADYAEAGQQLNAGSVVWISRTIWRYVNEGMTIAQSTATSRKEWRAALGLPPH